jgi:tetratricopeptide (TPR) repeat protein
MKKIFSMIMCVAVCWAAFFSCATTTGDADGHIPTENTARTGNHDEAADPDAANAKAYLDRGNTYFRNGDYDRAIAEYNEALRINPNTVEAYNNRGNAKRSKGEYDAAIADYNMAIRIKPDFADAYNNRGSAYYYKKNYERARSDWERALRINPNNTAAWNNLAILQRETENSNF